MSKYIKSAFIVILLGLVAIPHSMAEVRLASWNVLRLQEDGKDFDRMAEIIRYFDFVSLQEVMDEEGVHVLAEAVSERTGEDWSVMVSHLVGRGSYKESYAFLWRDSKIEFLDGAAVFVDEGDFFEREPLSARFRATEEDFTFLAANIHVIYGKNKSRREPELEALRAYWHWLDENWPNEPIFLFGDFNMDPSEDAWGHVLEVAYPALTEGATTLSTNEGEYANLYDNIWIARNTSYEGLRAGIFPFPDKLDVSHKMSRERISDHVPVFITLDGVDTVSSDPLPTYNPEEVYVSSSLNASNEDKERPAVVGNVNSMIYHLPGCPGYEDTAFQNMEAFETPEEAESAGYREARNC